MAEHKSRPDHLYPHAQQNYGGMPKVLQDFQVKDRPKSPRPTSNDSWNDKMGKVGRS
jgi:hypothetical protein